MTAAIDTPVEVEAAVAPSAGPPLESFLAPVLVDGGVRRGTSVSPAVRPLQTEVSGRKYDLAD